MRFFLCLICFSFVLLLPFATVLAEDNGNGLLTVELTADHVDITTGFHGAQLSLFGVKKHEGELAIVIRGTERRMVVRSKGQVMGVWMNKASQAFRQVPVYYDLALSAKGSDLAPHDLLKEHGIGLDALDFEPVGRKTPETIERFKEALIRNKQTQGHFPLDPKDIYFLNGDFFRTNFYVPSNVPTGDYTVTAYLFEDGKLLDRYETSLRVAQIGFSARLYDFAHGQGLLYGLSAVLFAVMAGWSAYMFLRKD